MPEGSTKQSMNDPTTHEILLLCDPVVHWCQEKMQRWAIRSLANSQEDMPVHSCSTDKEMPSCSAHAPLTGMREIPQMASGAQQKSTVKGERGHTKKAARSS